MKHLIPMLLICLTLFVAGCEPKPAAVVDGQKITEAALQAALKARAADHSARGAEVDQAALRAAVLNQLVDEALIDQGARAAGITVADADIDAHIKTLREQSGGDGFDAMLKQRGLTEQEYRADLKTRIMRDQFLATLGSGSEVTEEEARAYYDTAAHSLVEPGQMLVRFIQLSTLEEAVPVEKRLKAEGFGDVADDLAGQEGGPAVVSGYGWMGTGIFTGEIAAGLAGLDPGEYGGPFKGRDGYYFFSLKERKAERKKTFKEALPEIRAALAAKRQNDAITAWLTGKRASTEITIN
jgi:parvulin-like peptidyl-prolyl isomerase